MSHSCGLSVESYPLTKTQFVLRARLHGLSIRGILWEAGRMVDGKTCPSLAGT